MVLEKSRQSPTRPEPRQALQQARLQAGIYSGARAVQEARQSAHRGKKVYAPAAFARAAGGLEPGLRAVVKAQARERRQDTGAPPEHVVLGRLRQKKDGPKAGAKKPQKTRGRQPNAAEHGAG